MYYRQIIGIIAQHQPLQCCMCICINIECFYTTLYVLTKCAQTTCLSIYVTCTHGLETKRTLLFIACLDFQLGDTNNINNLITLTRQGLYIVYAICVHPVIIRCVYIR